MVERFSKFGDVCAQGGIIFCGRPGMEFIAAIAVKGLRRREIARELDAFQHYVHVPGIRKVVGADRGRIQRIAGAQTNIASAERMQKSWSESERVSFDLLKSVFYEIADAKMELQIGYLGSGRSFDKSPGLRHVR